MLRLQTGLRVQGIVPSRLAVPIAFLAAVALLFALPLHSQTGDDIVIGVSAALTGQSAGLGTELNRGANAYIRFINENGGLHGHQITLKIYDDGYQPAAAVQNTIKLAATDKVSALFNYVGTPTTTQVLPLLKLYSARKLDLFCPFTGAEQLRTPPYSEFVFNLRASYREEVEGMVSNFLSIGRKRIALFYQADAYGRSGWEAARHALMVQGLKIVSEATYKRGAAAEGSMREQVNILKAGDPDAVISVGSYAAVAAFIRDARDQGLAVPIANVSFVGSDNLLSLLNAIGKQNGKDYTGDLVNTQVVPSYEDTSVPAVVEYRKTMQHYDPVQQGTAPQPGRNPEGLSFVSFEGFLNAKLLIEVLRRAGYPLSGDQIRRAAESVHDFDIGLPERVTFTATKHQALDHVYFTTVKSGEFVPLTNWEGWRK